DGPTIKGADKQDITLAAGEHGLRIKRGDLEFETDKFILKKGETVTLKVEYLDGKVQVVQADGKVLGGGTTYGTARIEITDPDIQGVRDRDGPTIKETAPKHDITLASGNHRLKVKCDELEFTTDEFEVKKGETVTLSVERLPSQVQVVKADGTVLASR